MLPLIWFVGSAIIVGIGCFMEGSYNSDKPKEWDIGGFFFVGILWPVLLVIATVVAPFYGIYKLGRMSRGKV